jgi:hypothetical protein
VHWFKSMFCRLSGWIMLKWCWLKFWHPTGRHLASPLGCSSVALNVEVARTVPPNVSGTRWPYTVSQPKKSALWMCLLYFVKYLPGRKVYLFKLTGWMRLWFFIFVYQIFVWCAVFKVTCTFYTERYVPVMLSVQVYGRKLSFPENFEYAFPVNKCVQQWRAHGSCPT